MPGNGWVKPMKKQIDICATFVPPVFTMNPVIVPSLAPFPIAVPAIGIANREKPQRTMFPNRKKVS